jgi:enamine deaminase RidA (YjgF/YER057c/UK114 family)
MRKRIFRWLDREFVELSAEAKPAKTPAEEARELLRRFNEELESDSLSLHNTVRTRLWGRDRESRDQGSTVRVAVLSEKARSASSSYISPSHFDSGARVAIDLLAMRPTGAGVQKDLVEYNPPITPLRYLVYDSVVVLSGVTAVLPTLEEQLSNILPRIAASLRDAGTSWDRVAKVSFYLHRSQTVAALSELFRAQVTAAIPQIEYEFVDGYSAEGKLCEIEVTARV